MSCGDKLFQLLYVWRISWGHLCFWKIFSLGKRILGWQPVSFSPLKLLHHLFLTSQVAQRERIHCQYRRHRRHGFNPWVGKMPCRRKCQPTPTFLPGKSHGQRSLVGNNSPWSYKIVRHDWVIEHACTNTDFHCFAVIFSLSSSLHNVSFLRCLLL